MIVSRFLSYLLFKVVWVVAPLKQHHEFRVRLVRSIETHYVLVRECSQCVGLLEDKIALDLTQIALVHLFQGILLALL